LQDYQKKLFPYAYNILGSAEDAKDAIQDVVTNYLSLARTDMENELNYLIKGVINRSINIKHRKQRLQPSAWLPEPVATEQADKEIDRQEILTYSMLVLLEHLNAKERAVFILKEAFDYSHEEIGDILALTVENSRKLLSRAKGKLAAAKQEGSMAEDAHVDSAAFLERYVTVIKNGDTGALEKMLSEEVSYAADGGGRIKVISEHMGGLAEVARHLVRVFELYQRKLPIRAAVVNHQPALLFYRDGVLVMCQVFGLSGDHRIGRLYIVIDPAKLRNLNLV